MAPAVDYLAPEVYPESYSSGFFNLPDPQAAARRRGARVRSTRPRSTSWTAGRRRSIPWLQDYSSAVTYGVAEIQAQVDGAAAAGVVLVDHAGPRVHLHRRHHGSLLTTSPTRTVPTVDHEGVDAPGVHLAAVAEVDPAAGVGPEPLDELGAAGVGERADLEHGRCPPAGGCRRAGSPR